jgi:hypothetical protein
MGSIPIPSSTTEHIDFQQYLRQHIRECTSETYIKRIGRLAKIGKSGRGRIHIQGGEYVRSENGKRLLPEACGSTNTFVLQNTMLRAFQIGALYFQGGGSPIALLKPDFLA